MQNNNVTITSHPLCVDLDGTLINSDLLHETLIALLKKNILYLFLLPIWLLGGKAHFKSQIASRVSINAELLPYNKEFLKWLLDQNTAGRNIWLCTASNYLLANAVASYLNIFKGVIASSDKINLSGKNKADHLIRKFGNKEFDYCGNSNTDLEVWKYSKQAIVVNGSAKLIYKASTQANVIKIFNKKNNLGKAVYKSLRLHQWTKNLLLFVPLAAAHKISESNLLYINLLAFIAFGMCASSVYILNDMIDLENDRDHPRKCKRPFASGDLSLLTGFLLFPSLLLISLAICTVLPRNFQIVLACYYALTLLYSFGLKKIILIDTIMLASLYTIRIIGGATAASIEPSFWLLLFSIFLFLSLAFVKRYAELFSMKIEGKLSASGRAYQVNDLDMLHSMGIASGYLSVLVLALYINSPAVELLYDNPKFIWLLCPLLIYWCSRVWLITHRGQMHDDPVIFAIKDRVSLTIGLISTIIIYSAS